MSVSSVSECDVLAAPDVSKIPAGALSFGAGSVPLLLPRQANINISLSGSEGVTPICAVGISHNGQASRPDASQGLPNDQAFICGQQETWDPTSFMNLRSV